MKYRIHETDSKRIISSGRIYIYIFFHLGEYIKCVFSLRISPSLEIGYEYNGAFC